MNKLTRNQFLQICIMLFGLFFGAGNLIFPPSMGKDAGYLSMYALVFFAITAIIFPILGVIAVARTKGLKNLASRVSKDFALIYTALIYLSIGPGLGIPRAGSTPFTMIIGPHVNSNNIILFRLIYTCIFFLVAFWLCQNPSKMVSRMGKFLTPALIILITLLFIGLIFKGGTNFQAPVGDYKTNVYVTGFLNGYNTMDTVAALNFGLVISIAMSSMNIKDDKQIVRYSIRAGYAAGFLLLIIYAMLTYIGAATAGNFPDTKNGAEILSHVSLYVFGQYGYYILIAIFTLACLTTCVGLITSSGQYFASLTKVSYKAWISIWTIASFVLANFGLDFILKFSVPILLIIYPVSLMIIVISLIDSFFGGSYIVYRASIFTCLVFSILGTLVHILETNYNFKLPVLYNIFSYLPLYKQTLEWLIPSILALIISITYVKIKKK